jgi:hypothetical protein
METAPAAVVTLPFENSYDPIPAHVLAQATQIATRIYAGLGLRLEWKVGSPKPKAANVDCSRGAIQIPVRFTAETPNDGSETTLAWTFVYNMREARIHVLTNRVQHFHSYRPRLAGPLLGHVLAHEIAHVLQRINRHSESGILRAHWSEIEYQQMRYRGLEFEPFDVALIRLGVNSWLRSCSVQAMR